MTQTTVPSQDQKIHTCFHRLSIQTACQSKLLKTVLQPQWMMKENYCQTDYIVKKNGVSYFVPPSLNTYGTNANFPNEIQLRKHEFQRDYSLYLLSLGLDHKQSAFS